MIASSDRLGLKFCQREDGSLVNSIICNDLKAICRTCNSPIIRSTSNQLFQHVEKQCEGALFSELLERFSLIFTEVGGISLPITRDNAEFSSQIVVAAKVKYEIDVMPILALTLGGGQLIYLCLRTYDHALSARQLTSLRESFQSLIELDISNLTLPSSGLTNYLRNHVVNNTFSTCYTWLSLSPLSPLTRTIASLEAKLLAHRTVQEKSKLERIQSVLEETKSEFNVIRDNLQRAKNELYQAEGVLDKVAAYNSAEDLRKECINLEGQIKAFKEDRKLLKSKYGASTKFQLNGGIESEIIELRAIYRSGKRHIESQQKEVSSLTKQIESLNKQISDTKWIKKFLSYMDIPLIDIQSSVAKVTDAFNEIDMLNNQIKIKRDGLIDINKQIDIKSKKLKEDKDLVEYYSKEKFKLFREYQTLQSKRTADIKGID